MERSTLSRSETAGRAACVCAWQGCAQLGEYRAPKDRLLKDYVYFCLEHVRSYNARWNFHAGLGAEAIESELQSAATWDRPTWKLGRLGPGGARRQGATLDDPFDMAHDTAWDRRRQHPVVAYSAEQRRAMQALGIDPPISLAELKRRYKALVKKFHPDLQAGHRDTDDRMKHINAAYAVLKKALSATDPRRAAV
jgi:DnaJ-domain-containing protein 1